MCDFTMKTVAHTVEKYSRSLQHKWNSEEDVFFDFS